MDIEEQEELVTEADIIVKAHGLGRFMHDKTNKKCIQQRKNTLLDKAAELRTISHFDIPTQAALVTLFHNLLKGPSGVTIQDLAVILNVGRILGKEEQDGQD